MAKLTASEAARIHAETMALGYGFDPGLSEGAVKPPVLLTSTFSQTLKIRDDLIWDLRQALDRVQTADTRIVCCSSS